MKKLLLIIIISLALASCDTTKKSASGGTIIVQGKNHVLSLGNPRIRAQNKKKADAKILKDQAKN